MTSMQQLPGNMGFIAGDAKTTAVSPYFIIIRFWNAFICIPGTADSKMKWVVNYGKALMTSTIVSSWKETGKINSFVECAPSICKGSAGYMNIDR